MSDDLKILLNAMHPTVKVRNKHLTTQPQSPLAQSAPDTPDNDTPEAFRSEIRLPIKLTNGNGGRTKHYAASARLRKEYEALIRSLYGQQTPYPYPVSVKVTRALGKGERLFDFSSGFRGNYKEIEDSLVVCGFFHDDSPTWIRSVCFYQDDRRRSEGPCIEIEVLP